MSAEPRPSWAGSGDARHAVHQRVRHAPVSACAVRVAALLVVVVALLVAGIVGGLLRAGVAVPRRCPAPGRATPVAAHAFLMICAFMGTVIGIERAVAVKTRLAFVGAASPRRWRACHRWPAPDAGSLARRRSRPRFRRGQRARGPAAARRPHRAAARRALRLARRQAVCSRSALSRSAAPSRGGSRSWCSPSPPNGWR